MFNRIYHNKRVLITGHTGFKGSWLALWLSTMGAHVTGYSLRPPTEPNHFDLLDLDQNSIIGDIRDPENLAGVFKQQQPEIVFHLAAQPHRPPFIRRPG
jgi:CDP-glucose 4,6-dehydratase